MNILKRTVHLVGLIYETLLGDGGQYNSIVTLIQQRAFVGLNCSN